MSTPVGLTDAKIQGLKAPSAGQVEYPDKLVAGLRVRIGSTGTKTFTLRKRVGGKIKNVTLGRFGPRFRLSDARIKARNLLIDIQAGNDPTVDLAKSRRGSTRGTLRELVEQYLAQEVRGKKRSAREIERTFERYILPVLGDRLADSITRGDVTKLVEMVAFGGVRPTPRMGRGVYQQLSRFYSWALPSLDRLPANPCRDARKPPPSAARDRVLSEAELGALWRAADAEGYPFGVAVQLLVLTAQRRGEVLGASWPEVDLEGSTWVIPAGRAKNGQPNIVPLSHAAKRLLETVPRCEACDLIFPARTNLERPASGVGKAWERMLEATGAQLGGRVDRFTPHDIRRTVATGLQRIGTPLVVSEAVLNHQSGSKAGVAGVYHRHKFTEEKRVALEAWACEVEHSTRPVKA